MKIQHPLYLPNGMSAAQQSRGDIFESIPPSMIHLQDTGGSYLQIVEDNIAYKS